MNHRLDPLLQPRSIAMIGASNNPGRIGGMPLDLLRQFNYAGQVYPINPKYEEVFGYRCYPDVEALPSAPDLVVLAIGAEDVTNMLERCHAKGIRAAIVYAAGFAEAGSAGAELQAKLEQFAQRTGMVIAGPNCMGFANLNIHAYTAFASVFKNVPVQKQRGRASIITQSGNVCSAVFALIRKQGIPVSHFINTGNEAVVEFAEYLEYMAQDDATECVVGYVEQLRNGPRFMDAALKLATQRKPLIIYKAGETDKGSEAVRSHTSALAGDLALYKAGFAQLNVIRGSDFAQMADLAYLSGYRHRVGGERVAIVTMSGALGAILADKMIGAGLEVPTLSDDLQRTLRDGIPDYGMVSNPVDVTGNVVNSPEFVRTIFQALGETDQVDTIIVYAPGYLLDRMAEPLLEMAEKYSKLFVAIDTGAAKCREQLSSGGIPVFDDVGRATQALAPFCQWMARHAQVAQWADLRASEKSKKAGEKDTAMASLPQSLNEYQTKQLLATYGINFLPGTAAANLTEAVTAASKIGYPVALKILSADILHKTEVEGVRLNISDETQLQQACIDMLDAVTQHVPKARIDGFLVQPMATGAVAELIAGITNDPVFGAALTVGLGGVLTEIYKDASHRLLPVDEGIVQNMLRELTAWPLLDGYRGRPVADVNACCKLVAALSDAHQALGHQICDIEINPIQIRAQGQGAFGLDALVLFKPQTTQGDIA